MTPIFSTIEQIGSTGFSDQQYPKWVAASASFVGVSTVTPAAHDMVSAHTYTGGAALDVFGLSGAGTIAKLTPSSNPGAAAAILCTPTSGIPTLAGLIAAKWYPSADSTTALSINKADGTTNVVTIDTTNVRVGIGTTGPSQLLYLYKSVNGATRLDIENPNTGTSAYAGANFKNNNGKGLFFGQLGGNWSLPSDTRYLPGNGFIEDNGPGLTITESATSGYIRLLTTNAGDVTSEAVRIDGGGNVGIGTTSPTKLLSLGGNSARIFWMERHTTANTAGNDLTVRGGGATVAATDKAGGRLILTPGQSTGMGITSICTQRFARAASTATADNAVQDAQIIASEQNLTNNSAINLFDVALAAGAFAGGNIEYAITVSDGTDFQVYAGYVTYAAANKGDVYTTTITDLATVDSLAKTNVASTLVVTWSIVTGTSKITIAVNANSSLTPTSMKIYCKVHNGSMAAVTQW